MKKKESVSVEPRHKSVEEFRKIMCPDVDKTSIDEVPHVERLEQCPFCDVLFVDRTQNGLVKLKQRIMLRKHIRIVHKKVEVRKGSNYKWMDAELVKKLAGE